MGSLIDATFVGAEVSRAASKDRLSSSCPSRARSRSMKMVLSASHDPTGAVWAGRFARGLNPVCITIEAVLEEPGGAGGRLAKALHPRYAGDACAFARFAGRA